MTTLTETINAAAIYRVTDLPSGKFAGWLVKSNHSNEYYHIHCYKISEQLVWTCTCKAGQYGFKGCKSGHCCHVAAVIEVEEARKQVRAEQARAQAETQAQAEAAAAVAEAERQLAAERKPRKPRRKIAQPEVPAGQGGSDGGKEVSLTGESFPGRRATVRKRAKAFAGFERDLAPLGPQTGFSLLK